MKAVTHTPRVLVEEWDISGLSARDDDAAVLRAALGVGDVPAVRTSANYVTTGSPFVYSRGEDDLTTTGRRLADIEAARTKALDQARTMALDALDRGASERQVAASLNVDRSLVRSWRGK